MLQRAILLLQQGLGYNRRALFLKQSARIIVDRYHSRVPRSPAELVTLPGIGPATAASIAVFSYNEPYVFIETNIRSVFIHFFFKGQTNIPDQDILPLIDRTLDRERPRDWYFALMDYGAMLKRTDNPSLRSRTYARQSTFKGSNRQLRGLILKLLTEAPRPLSGLVAATIFPASQVRTALVQLEKEGFISRSQPGQIYSLAKD